jgi:hypothetical protein
MKNQSIFLYCFAGLVKLFEKKSKGKGWGFGRQETGPMVRVLFL